MCCKQDSIQPNKKKQVKIEKKKKKKKKKNTEKKKIQQNVLPQGHIKNNLGFASCFQGVYLVIIW